MVTACPARRRHGVGLGDDGEGELGLAPPRTSNVPTKINGLSDIVGIVAGGRHSLALARDGQVLVSGANGYGQLGDGTTENRVSPIALVPPPEAKDLRLKGLAAGQFRTLGVDTTGHAWACGWNVFGQLGNGSNTPPRQGVAHLVRWWAR